ncbi:hypothetical protein J2X69_003628 [Algoriphagus sp. 4150]|nr:hypothetical protein [Algoriphagus sp. 4150]
MPQFLIIDFKEKVNYKFCPADLSLTFASKPSIRSGGGLQIPKFRKPSNYTQTRGILLADYHLIHVID